MKNQKKNPSKKKANGNLKGKVGEREWVHFLKERGYQAERSEQYSGKAGRDSADVISEDLPFFHFEVKRVEALNINLAYEQADRDRNSHQFPLVVHRKNNQPWMITLSADHFFILVKHFIDLKLPSNS